jgi:hypothetical protein
MATTRPVVVITTAAPWLAALPDCRAFWMAESSAFCASAWIFELMLVTRSSPGLAGVPPTVPVTSPAALTDTRSVPVFPVSAWL